MNFCDLLHALSVAHTEPDRQFCRSPDSSHSFSLFPCKIQQSQLSHGLFYMSPGHDNKQMSVADEFPLFYIVLFHHHLTSQSTSIRIPCSRRTSEIIFSGSEAALHCAPSLCSYVCLTVTSARSFRSTPVIQPVQTMHPNGESQCRSAKDDFTASSQHLSPPPAELRCSLA